MTNTMTAPRYVIEGEWSGYHAGQRRVVHRSVHTKAFKRLRAWCEENGSIFFTDGTSLHLNVRDCRPRERVEVINGYGSLIADCAHYGVSSVEAVGQARESLRAARAEKAVA